MRSCSRTRSQLIIWVADVLRLLLLGTGTVFGLNLGLEFRLLSLELLLLALFVRDHILGGESYGCGLAAEHDCSVGGGSKLRMMFV